MNAKKYLSKITLLNSILIILCLSTTLFAAPTDFDGDGKTDFAIVRYNADGALTWYILQSRDGFRANDWGRDTGTGVYDIPLVIGDYDGDGRLDLAVYRTDLQGGNPAYWYVLKSRDNTMLVAQWGLTRSDDLVQADYDGDGKTDFAVYRNSWWYVMRSRDGFLAEKFGLENADRPLWGNDYDGDGKADLAVIRRAPVTGNPVPTTMYIRLSGNGNWQAYNVGDARFTSIVSGDYDGDGKSDVAIWQNQQWYWIRSSDGRLGGVSFGQPGDVPIPGDYDGDGKTDAAVIRREGVKYYYYILQSRDGFKAVQWGSTNTDAPIPTPWLPSVGF
ncbi:MAG TPA: VCBS repeat-containing protein [Pyrinomonadaceae bacterium]|nr:VCBS repeat-containing protein [Pyrinomonadaceae bacterium]